MINEKMTKTAKTIATILKVFECIAVIGLIVLVLAVLAILIFGNAVIQAASYTLRLDFVTLHFLPKYIAQLSIGKTYAIASVVAAIFDLALSFYVCRRVRSLVQPMTEGRPFNASSAGCFRKIGVAVVIHGVISQVGTIMTNMFFVQQFHLHEILDSPYLENVSFDFDFNFTFLLIAAMMFLLSYIFSYGQKLQQESDETL